jgi:hypothetical protein
VVIGYHFVEFGLTAVAILYQTVKAFHLHHVSTITPNFYRLALGWKRDESVPKPR